MSILEPRQFNIGLPVIRISASGVSKRVIKFHPLDNEPAAPDYEWVERHESDPTEVQSGKVYTHIDGFRLRAGLSFSYWHQDYATAADSRETFTEHDYRWLKLVQSGTTYDLEWFPYGEDQMGTPPNTYFHAYITGLTRQHPDGNNYLWNVRIDVAGVNRVTTIPVP